MCWILIHQGDLVPAPAIHNISYCTATFYRGQEIPLNWKIKQESTVKCICLFKGCKLKYISIVSKGILGTFGVTFQREKLSDAASANII